MVLWQTAFNLAKDCRALSRELSTLDPSQTFTLSGQLDRASVAVPSDIASASHFRGKKFITMLEQSLDSLSQCETCLWLVVGSYPTLAERAKNLLNYCGMVARMSQAIIASTKK